MYSTDGTGYPAGPSTVQSQHHSTALSRTGLCDAVTEPGGRACRTGRTGGGHGREGRCRIADREDRQVGQGRAVMAEQEPDTDGKPGDNKEEAEQVGQQLS